jgi:hypothetical protein
MEAGNQFLQEFRERYNARFGRPARDATDLHRALLPEQQLVDIFQEQREAKVTSNLTLQYKRVLYVLENCAAYRSIAGKHVRVFENEAGDVTIRFQGKPVRFRAFHKHGGVGVTPGDIVANKHLDGALTFIREKQQRREAERVAKLTTLRARRLAGCP